MDLVLNIIPAPLPDICDSEHERLAPITSTYEGQPRLSQQQKVTIIKVTCEACHGKTPPGKNMDIKATLDIAVMRVPILSSLENLADAHVSPFKHMIIHGKRPSESKNPSTPHTSFNGSPCFPRSPRSLLSASTIPTPPKHTSKSKMNDTQSRRKTSTSIPSNSDVSSCASDSSANDRLRVPRTPNQCPTSSTTRKNMMNDQAAETVRVMEWAMSLVKSAEKRVRQEERAIYEKEIFRAADGKTGGRNENPKTGGEYGKC